jgi:hypothetical protein
MKTRQLISAVETFLYNLNGEASVVFLECVPSELIRGVLVLQSSPDATSELICPKGEFAPLVHVYSKLCDFSGGA